MFARLMPTEVSPFAVLSAAMPQTPSSRRRSRTHVTACLIAAAGILAATSLTSTAIAADEKPRQPNVVLIMADDK